MTETYTIATDQEIHDRICEEYGYVVYFLHAPSVGVIKIGTSYRPRKRFEEIKTCCPVPIHFIGCVDGAAADERRWHERFADLRQHGEWFRESDELLEAIWVADMVRRMNKMAPDLRAAMLDLMRKNIDGMISDRALDESYAEVKALRAAVTSGPRRGY